MVPKFKEPRFVDAEDVPPVVRRTPWEEIFSSVPDGKARVFDKDEVHPSTIREALKRLQESGKFKGLYMTTRKTGNKRLIYIVNPSEETE